ncbi:MAG: T9SS type A sorting domain-containing protein [Bacteroidetes bacterium]|nr:T9SS type A sorting domain-containing protein [Bacteroidota bacterium]
MKLIIAAAALALITVFCDAGYPAGKSGSGELLDILIITNDNGTSAENMRNDLLQANYKVTLVVPDLVSPELFNSYRLVILSTGSNITPCSNNYMRFILQDYIETGGKVIVEGGQTGYVADIIPEYPAFKSKVLKINSWVSDDGGELLLNEDHISSTLANVPNILKHSMNIDYTSPADMDVCISSEFADVFFESSSFSGKAGILVFPDLLNPQVINYFFSYSRIEERSEAKNLLNNSVYNLIGNPTGIQLSNNEIPGRFILYQNYPNPFNPSTKVNFAIPERSDVIIYVYNILGMEIETASRNLPPGTYNYTWTPKNLPSGTYFMKFEYDNKSYPLRVVYTK